MPAGTEQRINSVKTSVPRHSQVKLVSAPAGPFDKVAFGEQLADAIVMRRATAGRLIPG